MKSAIILANGTATRYGSDKLAVDVLGSSVIERTVNMFLPVVDEIIIVSNNQNYKTTFPFAKVVSGGDTRTQSVICGLAELSKDSTLVAIHDGARPFVKIDTIERLFNEAQKSGSAIPSLNVTDTVYYEGQKLQVLDRQKLRTVQTPQVFNTKEIIHAYKTLDGKSYTDDSQVYFATYNKLSLVDGQSTNKKLTYAHDLPTYKSGVGYDVHQFIDGDILILGGVHIPFNKKLLGHSDADVLLHAVMDALLGATGNKDIGHLFPDTDMQYKGADSMVLLSKVYEVLKSQGYSVVNVSATVVAQAPKLAPYKPAFEQNIAKCLQMATNCVNVSATTTEGLGIVGEGKGIACYATCVVMQ